MIHPTLPMADYVSDNLGDPRPALSSGIAHKLITKSPKHAWTAHPKLNPAWQRHEDSKFDLGTAFHAIMLGDNGTTFEVIDGFEDWRKGEAKERRDAARASGKLPLLTHQYEAAREMREAATAQLAQHEIGNPFSSGAPEVTLTWEVGPTLCKARLDWMPPAKDGEVCFYDLKSTTETANPEYVDRRLEGTGAFVQAALYSAGIVANYPNIRPRFRFILVETEPPYALSVVEPDDAAMGFARADVVYAIALWTRCLAEGKWPGYSSTTHKLVTPSWKFTRDTERELREEEAAAAKADPFDAAMVWE